MRVRLIVLTVIIAVLGFLTYSYIYKGHRDFSSEDSIEISSVEKIFNEFKLDENKANTTYLDKVIQIKGKVTQIDASQNNMTIDEKLFSSFQKNDFKKIELHSEVIIKGRFIGYDELLEELKMDNCVILE